MRAASGLFPWNMELLAFASHQFARNARPLSASFTMFSFYYFLVSERSGRKPPAERSALHLFTCLRSEANHMS